MSVSVDTTHAASRALTRLQSNVNYSIWKGFGLKARSLISAARYANSFCSIAEAQVSRVFGSRDSKC